MINYYVVLEIPNYADESVIKKAYRTLSKKYHPDVNNDPLASTYFQTINEAYNFLMDENKRLLLNQFLSYADSARTYNKQHATTYEKANGATEQPLNPVIEVFFCDRKSFSLNDSIFIQWHVSNAKSVKINLFGDVLLADSKYYRVTKYSDELSIVLEILGYDHNTYTSTIKIPYYNEIPAKRAYHKMLSNDPNTKEIHFKDERFFHTHSRISRLTFINRNILLLVLLVLNILGFYHAAFPHFYFVIICSLLATIWVQFIKRFHDLVPTNNEKTPHKKERKHSVIRELFFAESVNGTNTYGMYPEQEKLTFFKWIQSFVIKFNKERSFFEKTSILCFISVLILYSFQNFRKYDEFEAHLTNFYVARGEGSGTKNSYKLQFNHSMTFNVTENEYYDIAEKKYDVYKLGVSKANELKYILAINNEEQLTKKIGLGLISNSNPLILIISLLFLGQVYVMTQFKKKDEKFYGTIYLGFTIFVYLMVIVGFLL